MSRGQLHAMGQMSPEPIEYSKNYTYPPPRSLSPPPALTTRGVTDSPSQSVSQFLRGPPALNTPPVCSRTTNSVFASERGGGVSARAHACVALGRCVHRLKGRLRSRTVNASTLSTRSRSGSSFSPDRVSAPCAHSYFNLAQQSFSVRALTLCVRFSSPGAAPSATPAASS
jgi:hypothetical protein